MTGLLTTLLDVSIANPLECNPVGFTELFAALLSRAGISQNSAGPMLGCSGPFVNQIVKGKRKPPLDQISSWARTLGLVEGTAEWDEFHLEAQLAHSPEALRPFVRNLVSELSTLKKDHVGLRNGAIDQAAKIASLADENARLRAQLEQQASRAPQIFGNTPEGGRQGPGGGRISRGKPPGGAGAPDHA